MAGKGSCDIGVPIGDAAGRKLGMTAVIIPANRAADAKLQVYEVKD
jgi:hypothetical protein